MTHNSIFTETTMSGETMIAYPLKIVIQNTTALISKCSNQHKLIYSLPADSKK